MELHNCDCALPTMKNIKETMTGGMMLSNYRFLGVGMFSLMLFELGEVDTIECQHIQIRK